jgi:hypothetical protein
MYGGAEVDDDGTADGYPSKSSTAVNSSSDSAAAAAFLDRCFLRCLATDEPCALWFRAGDEADGGPGGHASVRATVRDNEVTSRISKLRGRVAGETWCH